MRTKTVNKILGMICIMLCFWSLSIPCFAASRNLSMSKSVTAKAGSTYRTKATITVWLNGKDETKIFLSNETIA